MRNVFRFLLTLLPLLTVVLITHPVQAEGGHVPGYLLWSQDGTIVVWVGNQNIYAASADGKNFWFIADCCNLIGIGVLPDQTKIIWYGGYDYRRQLEKTYAVALDGSNRHEIDDALQTAWFSPDGRQVVFEKEGELYLMDTNGSHQIRLTQDNFHDTLLPDYYPRPLRPQSYWSPDGTQIAFHSDRDGNRDIFVMNRDGSNVRNMSNREGDDYFGTWSPDGKQIVFYRADGIYVVDNSHVIKLTGDFTDASFEGWSPNGERIVFKSSGLESDPGWGYYFTNADGTNLQRITNDERFQYMGWTSPVWSKDNQQFFVQVWDTEKNDACVIQGDQHGDNLHCVFEGGGGYVNAFYTPDRERIVIQYERFYGLQLRLFDPTGEQEEILIETPNYDIAIAKINNASEQAATYLDLSYMGLATLPPGIEKLTSLTSLSLSGNKLTTIPAEIFSLTNLNSLSLDANLLTELPPQIATLSNLTRLSLSGNKLRTFPAEIFSLTNLNDLYLGENLLTELPPQISELSNLKSLNLTNNRLTKIPDVLTSMLNLPRFSGGNAKRQVH